MYAVAAENGAIATININSENNNSTDNKYDYITKKFPVYTGNTRRVYSELFGFTKITTSSDILLSGHFQNELYFKDYKKDILELFQEPASVTPFIESLDYTNLVAIHVRLGNFTTWAKDALFIDLNDYYTKAIEYMKMKNPNSRFVIVSEESPATVLGTYKKSLGDILYNNIERGNIEPELVDFYFMSRCNAVICANSTFSWWAGYLNNNIVVLPGKFTVDSKCPEMSGAHIIQV